MFKTLLIAGAFACLPFAANAQECVLLDDIVQELATIGATAVLIEPEVLGEVVAEVESVDGLDLGDVTRGFFVAVDGSIVIGFEVAGCLLPPVRISADPILDNIGVEMIGA